MVRSIVAVGSSGRGTPFASLRAGSWGALGGARPAPTVNFRQTEVENLRLPARGDEDIRRLDVAMGDALLVRRVKSLRDLDG